MFLESSNCGERANSKWVECVEMSRGVWGVFGAINSCAFVRPRNANCFLVPWSIEMEFPVIEDMGEGQPLYLKIFGNRIKWK